MFGKRPENSRVRRSSPPLPARTHLAKPVENRAQLSQTSATRPLQIPFQGHDGYDPASNSLSQNLLTPVAYSSPSSGLDQPTSLIQEANATGAVLEPWQQRATEASNQPPSLCDLIASKFDAVITSIDSESFSGDERELGAELPFLCCLKYLY